MPELPGSEGDEPTARRHRTRPAEPASPAGVLHGSEIRSFVTETATFVNENETRIHYKPAQSQMVPEGEFAIATLVCNMTTKITLVSRDKWKRGDGKEGKTSSRT
jgi:hypothetical protein